MKERIWEKKKWNEKGAAGKDEMKSKKEEGRKEEFWHRKKTFFL